MKIHRSICCKELEKIDVVDSKGQKIGRIGDLVFKFEKELKLSKFILAGSKWEELLESLNIKEDRDPVFDSSRIMKIDEYVHLNTSVNELKTTLDTGAIQEDEIRYSSLKKMEIVDSKGVKVGHALDVDFDLSGAMSMIVGGGFFEEKLEALGIKSDVDIIVPGEVISSIADKIHLKVAKDELETTIEGAIKSEQTKKLKESKKVSQQVMKVRLFTQRPL